MPVSRQQREFYKTFSQHGSGDARVIIQPKDVVLLIHIAFMDLYESETPDWFNQDFLEIAKCNFYNITPEMIDKLPEMTIDDAVSFLQKCGATNTDNAIYLYLKNLSELYRRRFKYYNILRTQAFPHTEQIGPRCLLEYGNCEDDLLFSWMSWRKLIFDIDNRSAQETGYLFEPIIASCLGGESVSHRHSPVKRLDENGNSTAEGRQIDCYIAEEHEVYELKLRVTIAASGQGRFNEEMTFPHEAKAAGLRPILIVFDPTPSTLLDKLKDKYVSEGGTYAIGENAWNMLISRAGKEMGKYIEKYIRPPISKMEEEYPATPEDIMLSVSETHLAIKNSKGASYTIKRQVSQVDSQ